MAHIEINNLRFSYPDQSQPALHDISLRIEKGEFVVLFGASGSGKSTLLKLLKKEIRPHGSLSGSILLNGKDVQESSEIGFVFQDPENQVIADDVLHEIAFGLENIGLSKNEMRSRVAEMVHFFGVEPLLHRKMHELSGGKKQQINLASVLLMQPDIVLLDEPTSQLDPVSTRELLDMLKRLNEEFGMTIILAEHRLEEVFALADRVIMLDKGEIKIDAHPKQALNEVWNSPNQAYVPAIPKLYFSLNGQGEVPLSVKEGRGWLKHESLDMVDENHEIMEKSGEVLLSAKNLFFRYDRKTDFILKECDFTLHKGEFYALMGGNGSGKSTLLMALAGLQKPEQGKILFHKKALKSYKDKEWRSKIGFLPQNPKLFFIHDQVGLEIQETMDQWKIKDWDKVSTMLAKLGIAHLLSAHPYDLSGGELQKAALACLLIREPEILLLDEPTKGLDPISKENLAQILLELQERGMTILLSTHDIEFAAQYASRCGMMFQGGITAEEAPGHFFKGNFFYSTMVQRLLRHTGVQHVISVEEVIRRCAAVKQ